MRLVDSHCHLDFPEFSEEIEAVVGRARGGGRADDHHLDARRAWRAARRARGTFPEVYFTIGTHPHQAAEEAETDAAAIRAFAAHPKCVGIGEAGLDYHYNYAPPAIASEVFRAPDRRSLASWTCRWSSIPATPRPTPANLEEEMGQGRFGRLSIASPARARSLKAASTSACRLRFPGVLTFKNSDELREIARDVRSDRLLVETDAPYLAPAPARGKRNEPAFVAATARVVAEARESRSRRSPKRRASTRCASFPDRRPGRAA